MQSATSDQPLSFSYSLEQHDTVASDHDDGGGARPPTCAVRAVPFYGAKQNGRRYFPYLRNVVHILAGTSALRKQSLLASSISTDNRARTRLSHSVLFFFFPHTTSPPAPALTQDRIKTSTTLGFQVVTADRTAALTVSK